LFFLTFRLCLGTRPQPRSQKFWNFFFLLKLNMVYMFWTVLMCWCQKWFLKNEKTSLAYILARKVIWKAPATILPNTLFILLNLIPMQEVMYFSLYAKWSFSNLTIYFNFLIINTYMRWDAHQGCQKRFFDTTRNIQYKLES